MAFRDKKPKRKENSDNKYYNCHKLGHFKRDCFLLDKRLNRTIQQSRREKSQRKDLWRERQNRDYSRGQNNLRAITNWAHQALENRTKHNHHDNFEPKLFIPGTIGTAFLVKEKQSLQKTLPSSSFWFLDLYVSWYQCNNQHLFINIRVKNIDFMMATSQVMWIEEIDIVSILLVGGTMIELQNMALTPECNSNLISLSQL